MLPKRARLCTDNGRMASICSQIAFVRDGALMMGELNSAVYNLVRLKTLWERAIWSAPCFPQVRPVHFNSGIQEKKTIDGNTFFLSKLSLTGWSGGSQMCDSDFL